MTVGFISISVKWLNPMFELILPLLKRVDFADN